MTQRPDEILPESATTRTRIVPELDDDELDDVSGGALAEFQRHGMQPDGGGARAHC